MTTIYDYFELYTKKDPELMKRVGMDLSQRNSLYNKCRWSTAILERIGNDIQNKELTISTEQTHLLSMIMRDSYRSCKKYK